MQAKIDDLDKQLEAGSQQLATLEHLSGSYAHGTVIHEPWPADAEGELLRGAAIRVVAVPLLLQKHGPSPIHYRDWYALLTQEGYVVAGKRPDAVFLNQVSRSPLVRSTTKSGYYVVKTEMVEQLQEQLGRLQSQLADILQDVPAESALLEANRKKQQELNAAIRRTERELHEAVLAIESANNLSATADDMPQAKAA